MAFSSTNHAVFKSFKYSLGHGDIKGRRYKDLKVYLTDSNFYKTNWHRMKGKKWDSAVEGEKELDYNTIRLRDIKKPYRWYEEVSGKNVVKGLSTTIYPTNLTLTDCILDSYNNLANSSL